MQKRGKILLLSIAISLFLLFPTIKASTPGNINFCQTLDTPGAYNLIKDLSNSDVNSTGCFVITSSDVELNCQGFSIIGNNFNTSGIFASYVNNTSIKNCIVQMSSFIGGIGISLDQVKNSFILNNNLNYNY